MTPIQHDLNFNTIQIEFPQIPHHPTTTQPKYSFSDIMSLNFII